MVHNRIVSTGEKEMCRHVLKRLFLNYFHLDQFIQNVDISETYWDFVISRTYEVNSIISWQPWDEI